MYEPAMRELAIQGSEPSALHNNCSGKHTGFLATALYLGETRDNYIALLHPTQQRWLTALAELADCSLQHMPMGVDGCSIPSPALPLHRLARAYAKFGTPQSCGPVRAAAIARISAAVRQHPHLIAGEGRACTRIVAATGGRVLVKVGAEGVFAGFIPEAGVGFALKIADGASRAAEVAVIGLIRRALGTAHPLHEALEPLARQVILTRRDVPAGVIRPTAAL
jgi:L-asparaginase II